MIPTMLRHLSQNRILLAATLISAFALAIAANLAVGRQARPLQQVTFASPENAIAALVGALRDDDLSALGSVLGPGSADIINSGDSVADREARDDFVKAYEQKWTLAQANADAISLQLGDDQWPFPIPLVRWANGWRFDVAAGRDELISRRVGRNETNAIEASLAFVDAQREYASSDRDGDWILEYAQRFRSRTSMKDGLYWPAQSGETLSPLGPLFASAQAEGYSFEASDAADKAPASPQPYLGYYYKILNTQGPAARGGAYDYIVGGNMIGGVAMIAYPVSYGISGIMSFIVNHDGIVYQKDLGSETPSVASSMTTFNPDETWQRGLAAAPIARAP
jgi:hypothetical protein